MRRRGVQGREQEAGTGGKNRAAAVQGFELPNLLFYSNCESVLGCMRVAWHAKCVASL